MPHLRTSITVIEKLETETPGAVSVLDSGGVRALPGVNLDDRLRQVPGFSLLRRTSSLVAHPTTQGVSLRGIGPTGASRTLVLWDGIPVNDPFGGWVYWTRFSPDEMQRIELSRGASTSVFGDRAMGGAIAMFSRPAEPYRLTASYEGGNRNTHQLSAGMAHLHRQWGFSSFARAFDTDGYFIVPEQFRGPVDRRAGVRFLSGDANIDYLGARNRVGLKFDMLAEARENGTELQTNSTGLGTISGRFVRDFTSSSLTLAGYHTREQLQAVFSAITAGRVRENLTFRQRVPAHATGGSGIWNRSSSTFSALLGSDFQRVEGFSHETLPTGLVRSGGGDLLQHGYFGQVSLPAGPARLFAGVRQNFAGEHRRYFSPSAGVVVGRSWIRGRVSAYRGFRVPTLNELYREFRVGNAVTLANAALGPETLSAVEAGADLIGENTTGRVTFFRNSLNGLVTNVTLSATPAQIVRQRQNAGSALSRGAEFEGERRWRHWRGNAAYLYVDSRFSTRDRLPQVPRHQGSASLSYLGASTLVTAAARSYSSQFEDDQNLYLLPGFATVQLSARQRIARNLSVLVAVENLLNRTYYAGFTPTPITGAPLLWRAGLRWDGRIR